MTYTNLRSIVTEVPRQVTVQRNTRPMSVSLSVILFAIPTLIFVISYHFIRPWLETFGLTPFESLVVPSPFQCLGCSQQRS